ncbi:WD40 repeat-like protein [Linnemannia elongata AG-77]|uniref:WD40 repeat-like protein n=1 Tax=Linnemannia elongata AG-77 TaxID=1314771 RepID=A0A197JJF5_9FUNG|nr:WD40 repeat-like protein [Linnemannia elongata AG-77]
MSFSSLQDNPLLQPNLASPVVSGNQGLNHNGERIFSQLDRAAKIERVKVQELPTLEHALYLLRVQKTEQYKQVVYIDPFAKPNLKAPDDKNLFLLIDKVKEFLAGEGQVMLILGDSGAGKSAFNRHLEYELWQEYRPGDRIPLFINLPALDRPDKNLITEQLQSLEFSEQQIQDLRQHHQLLLICDGYDESQLTSNLHTTNALNRPGQQDIKLIITCRTQYLGPDYRDRFVPRVAGGYHLPANDLFHEAVIAPFTKDQIEKYVEKYVPLEPRTWITKEYMDKLATIPNLMDLVKNPFLLTLALEALPMVVQGKSDLSRLRVTRVQLFDIFVDHWLGVNKRRLQDQKLDKAERATLDELLEDGFEKNGIKFQRDLAAAIFKEQGGRPVVEYVHKRDKASWKALFFSHGFETTLLRDASLLSRAGTQYRFVHRSVLEYFFSCTICEPADINDADADTNATPLPVGDHPLSQSLIEEPSIVQFLAERAQIHPGFKEHLHALLELSKSDPLASQAAANAISIIVRAGVQFNGADLRSVRIPGADLTGGQFDSAQFLNADLTGVNLTKTWIRQVDFSRALMDRVMFGELPYLQEECQVDSCAFSPDGRLLATTLNNNNMAAPQDNSIGIYDTGTWTKTHTLRGHNSKITGVVYSPCSRYLVSGSWDGTVRLWNCETGMVDRILEGHSEGVEAVALSPCGKQVASVYRDRSLRLWDVDTGACTLTLSGLADIFNRIVYSPNGLDLAVYGDGGIGIYNVRSKPSLLALRREDAKPLCLAFSPEGRRIVAGDILGKVVVYDAASLEPEFRWKAHVQDVTGVGFSPDGQLLVSCSRDSLVKLWGSNSGALISNFTGHTKPVASVNFSPDGSKIASSSHDQTVRLWSHVGWLRQYHSETGEISLSVSTLPGRTECVAYSPDGLFIASGGRGGRLTIRSTQTGEVECVMPGHKGRVLCVAFSPCGRWIASGGNDKAVRLWNAHSRLPFRELLGYWTDIISIEFSGDGREVVSGCQGGVFRVWDVESGVSKKSYQGFSSTPCTIAYFPGRFQLAFARKGKVDIWDDRYTTYQNLLHVECMIKHFAISPCGEWIIVAGNGKVHLFVPKTPRRNKQPFTRPPGRSKQPFTRCMTVVDTFFGEITGLGWRPDALEFATSCNDGSVRVWKLVQDEDTGEVEVKMIWSSGCIGLAVSDAVFSDAVGLSSINRKLLKQRGAFVEIPSIQLQSPKV